MRRVPRDIPTAMKELGINPERENDEEVFALCPGHFKRLGRDDRKASNWSVNKETGDHNCFSCGYSGTFLDLVVDVGRMDIWSALRWIRRHGVRIVDVADLPTYRDLEVEQDSGGEEVEKERKRKEPISEARLALFWRPSPQKLEERLITPASAELYDVLWDGENHGWVVPIRLPNGTLIGWQFKNKRWFDNYPRGVEKSECVYGLELLEPGNTAMLIESPLDCPRTHAAIADHRPDVVPVSGYGVEVTDVQMRLILERTDKVMFAFDNDKAGRKLTQALSMGVEKRGKVTRRGWAARFTECTVYNYGDSKGKDQGEQSDDEILWGIEHKFPVASLRLGRIKDWSDDEEGDDRASKRGRRPARTAGAGVRGAIRPAHRRQGRRDRQRRRG